MSNTALSDLFGKISDSDALIVEPAGDMEIERCNEDLLDIDLRGLPEEHALFFRTASGFAWNGFQFFGTWEVREKSSGYVLADIVGYNERIRERRDISDALLIVGTFDEDVYVYDYDRKRYYALDRLTWMHVDDYDSFQDLLLSTVGAYVD